MKTSPVQQVSYSYITGNLLLRPAIYEVIKWSHFNKQTLIIASQNDADMPQMHKKVWLKASWSHCTQCMNAQLRE